MGFYICHFVAIFTFKTKFLVFFQPLFKICIHLLSITLVFLVLTGDSFIYFYPFSSISILMFIPINIDLKRICMEAEGLEM